MEEQEEPTPQEAAIDQIQKVPLDRRNFTLTDVFTNVLQVGDIKITSPIMPIKEMVSTTKKLLKDKEVRSYLQDLKDSKIKMGMKYFG